MLEIDGLLASFCQWMELLNHGESALEVWLQRHPQQNDGWKLWVNGEHGLALRKPALIALDLARAGVGGQLVAGLDAAGLGMLVRQGAATPLAEHLSLSVADRIVNGIESGEAAAALPVLEQHSDPESLQEADLVLPMVLGWVVQHLQVEQRVQPGDLQPFQPLLATLPEVAQQHLAFFVASCSATSDELRALTLPPPLTDGPSLLCFSELRRALLLEDSKAAQRAWNGLPEFLHHGPTGCFMAGRLAALEGDDAGARAHLCLARDLAAALGCSARIDLEFRLARDWSGSRLLQLVFENEPPRVSEQHAATISEPTRHAMLGISETQRALLAHIERCAQFPIPVLIRGQTGTGKELVARALHAASSRKDQPFIAVNCAGIPDTLLADEFFGHRKGAYSGADQDRPGLLQQAGSGTLFLDEIGDLPAAIQATLLRLLDDGEYRPLGSSQIERAQCRFIAATNVDLEQAIAAGSFRADLAYRLRRLEILLSPLSERLSDLPVLAQHFMLHMHPQSDAAELSAELLQALTLLPWPGNIRQLRNDIEALVCAFPAVTDYRLEHLRAALQYRADGAERLAFIDGASYPAVPAEGITAKQEEAAHTDTPPRDREERLTLLLSIAAEQGRLTRRDVMAALDISQSTATNYLHELCQRGNLKRIEPTKAPRSFYFIPQ